MKQYTEDMDQKCTGNKGSLVYAGIKSIVKASMGKYTLTDHLIIISQAVAQCQNIGFICQKSQVQSLAFSFKGIR